MSLSLDEYNHTVAAKIETAGRSPVMPLEWSQHKEDMLVRWIQSRADEIAALGAYVEVDNMDRFHIACDTQEILDRVIAWMDAYSYEYNPSETHLHLWSDLIERGSGHIGFVSYYDKEYGA